MNFEMYETGDGARLGCWLEVLYDLAVRLIGPEGIVAAQAR